MLEVTPSSTLCIALVSAMAATVSSCATSPAPANFVRATPVNSPVAPLTMADGFYGGAVAAIDRRDYGRALELLQLARQGKVADVRVLNALGVVYDKLGRFDLSQRYYAEASAADPTSNIVQSNIAYSERLRDQGPRGEIQLAAAPILKVLPTALAKPAVTVQSAIPSDLPPRTVETAIVVPIPAAQLTASTVQALAQTARNNGPPPMQPNLRQAVGRELATARPLGQQRTAVAAGFRFAPAVQRRVAEAVPAPAALPSPFVAVEARPPLASAALVPTVQRTAARPSVPMGVPARAVATEVVHAVSQESVRPAEVAALRTSTVAEPPRFAKPAKVVAIASARPIAERPMPPAGTAVVRPAVGTVSPERLRVAVAPPPRAVMALASMQVARRIAGPATSVRPPLRIINASGEIRRAEPIRSSLASLGWSAPRWAVMETRVQARSVIYYPATRVAVARALASTLPGTTRLVPCTNGCGGLQLVLGSDARGWKPMRWRPRSA